MPFILLEVITTDNAGEPIYFKEWTGIGPACTKDFSEAETFATLSAATLNRAYSFGLTSFVPYYADEDEIWDRLTEPDG